MWILGRREKEFALLYLPGLFAVCVAIFFPDLGEESVIYALLAVGVVDSGHVYTTAWRTWLHPEEVRSSRRYWLFPIIFCALFTAWFYVQLPYLWTFVVYATLYHHTRQVFGFSKWYQKINGRFDVVSDLALYFFALLPIVIYHFRPEAIGNYYSENDLFLFPSPFIRDLLLVVYLLGVFIFVFREIRLWIKGVQELNRLLSIAVPGVVYAYCFLFGKTVTQVLFPLLFLHGIAYFAVMDLSLKRTQIRFSEKHVALLAVVGTAVIFGLFESWAEENLIRKFPEDSPFLISLVVGLFLTPLFCHYAFDAVIWKKGHREAAKVFSALTSSSEPASRRGNPDERESR